MKQNPKICAIGEEKTECNKLKSLSEEDKEGMVEREKRED